MRRTSSIAHRSVRRIAPSLRASSACRRGGYEAAAGLSSWVSLLRVEARAVALSTLASTAYGSPVTVTESARRGRYLTKFVTLSEKVGSADPPHSPAAFGRRWNQVRSARFTASEEATACGKVSRPRRWCRGAGGLLWPVVERPAYGSGGVRNSHVGPGAPARRRSSVASGASSTSARATRVAS